MLIVLYTYPECSLDPERSMLRCVGWLDGMVEQFEEARQQNVLHTVLHAEDRWDSLQASARYTLLLTQNPSLLRTLPRHFLTQRGAMCQHTWDPGQAIILFAFACTLMQSWSHAMLSPTGMDDFFSPECL